ncbi:MAG: hypothetical protein WCR33_00620 [Bacilli bacterium]
MKNSINAKKIVAIVFGSAFSIISLIYFILSYSKATDEWGTDISASKEYFVMLLIGLVILISAIYSYVGKSSELNKSKYLVPMVTFTVGSLGTLYFISVILSTIINNGFKSLNNMGPVVYICLIFIFVFSYGIINLLNMKNEK